MIEFVTDYPASSFDIEQLAREAAAVDGLSHITVGNDLVVAFFHSDPTATQIGQLDAVIDNHVPGSKHVKLWRYIERRMAVSRLDVPTDVDFVTGITTRLHPTNSIIVDGEVRQTDYFASATMNAQTGAVTYDDLIVRETFVYQRDAVGFARGRTQTITWYREDGTAHPTTKTRVKLYEPEESLREGQRRRSNITDKLAMDMAGWLMATQTQLTNPQDRLNLGRDFMRAHKLSFDMFVESSSAQILYDVRDDADVAHEWLDDELTAGVTIRATILDALNIWNLPL